MTRFLTAAAACLAITFAALAPASACGPYGDPTAMAEQQVEWSAAWLTQVRAELDTAIESGDADTIRESVTQLEAALASHADAVAWLADAEADAAARAESVRVAAVGE